MRPILALPWLGHHPAGSLGQVLAWDLTSIGVRRAEGRLIPKGSPALNLELPLSDRKLRLSFSIFEMEIPHLEK